MRCLSPRTVGFLADGKTISWSSTKYSKEYAPFQLPCSKCIECRLEFARQWAIRCVHEAKMHENNCFITLTYSDENLESPKLQYKDFQEFMKRLRYYNPHIKIGVFVTGEYGEDKKRPHWHAILFNYSPSDMEYHYTTDNGDKIYKSKELDKIWGKNDPEKSPTNIGAVTMDSAGYCARYAAKKLVHGKDQEHDWHPISKRSSKHAIGKKFLESYWQDIFNYGKVVLPDGTSASIPRYYQKWLQKHQPAAWERYITQTKKEQCLNAQDRSQKETEKLKATQEERLARGNFIRPTSIQDHRRTIIESRFKRLQQHLKGDI